MRLVQKIAAAIAVNLVFAVPVLHATEAAKKAGTQNTVGPEVDNSKINKREDSVLSPAADQQSNDSLDVETTRKIRSALTDNKSLSVYAHNIKIITKNGFVTLKGPVRSAEEKRIVEAEATKVAGVTQVKSEVEVKVK